MILAVDIGNANIVLGLADENTCKIIGNIATNRQKTEDEYAISLKFVLEQNKVLSTREDSTPLAGAIIASVVPPLSEVISRAIEKVTGFRPILVGPGVKTGLNIIIDNPSQLGSGLVVNSVAAIDKYQVPLIVIDMGTATTFCVIDKDKRYIGGALCPGVMISLEALVSGTSQLPRIGLDAPKSVIGNSTVSAINSGAVYGNAAMIDGLIERIEQELGQKTTIIATGQIAQFILPFCDHEIIYDESLLLRGLWLVWKKNRT